MNKKHIAKTPAYPYNGTYKRQYPLINKSKREGRKDIFYRNPIERIRRGFAAFCPATGPKYVTKVSLWYAVGTAIYHDPRGKE